MEKFDKLSAIAAPIMRQNIDTDMVIRVERLRDLPPDKLGPYAFESWRYKPDGSEAPEFVLNRPPYRDAKIILAADNFGCRSSREAAVWPFAASGIARGQAKTGLGVYPVAVPGYQVMFVAEAKGYLKDEGYDFRLIQGGSRTKACAIMAAGEADFLIADILHCLQLNNR